jgi:hypothetical protein
VTYTNASGCDSVHTYNVTINYSNTGSSNHTACDATTVGGQSYTASGSHNVTYTNASGCDSVHTYNVTINYSNTGSSNHTACDATTVGGQSYTASGSHNVTYTNASGCDSVHTYNVTINYSNTGSSNHTACDATTVGGQSYTASGSHNVTYTNAAGCDSVHTYNVTILYSTTGSTSETACDSYTWNGNTYTTSGIYTGSFTNAVGCDSVHTLNLTINYSSASTENVSACVTYIWPVDGMTYTQSGVYTHTGSNAFGCEHITTLNLTINQLPTVTATDLSSCPNSPLTLIGSPAGGTFSVANPYTGPSTTYTYTYTDGNGCTNTSAPASIIVTNSVPVTGVFMSNIGDNTAVVNWNGVPGLGWYEVRFRLVGDPTWTGGGTQAAPTTFKNIINLTAGGSYEIQVRGFCSLGNPGPWGNSAYFTTLTGCPAPINMYTSNVTATGAKFNWDAQPAAAFYETRYRKVGGSWINGSSTPNSKNIAGLVANTDYEWQVRSVCLPLPYSRSSWSIPESFTTLASKPGDVVEETASKNLISLYPNPAKDILNIEIEAESNQQVILRMFDISGRQVKEMEVRANSGLNKIQLNISDLESGLYHVQFFVDQQLSFSSKVSKLD